MGSRAPCHLSSTPRAALGRFLGRIFLVDDEAVTRFHNEGTAPADAIAPGTGARASALVRTGSSGKTPEAGGAKAVAVPPAVQAKQSRAP